MKKQTNLKSYLVISVFLLASSSFAGTYSGGSGDPNDPYIIADANDMQEIGLHEEDWDKHFVLTADIDLSSYTGEQFNIIGQYVGGIITDPINKPFSGVFEGDGHTISNFSYSCSGKDFVAIFVLVYGGEIKNIGIIDPNVVVNGGGYVGSLVSLLAGTVTNCYVRSGSVYAEGVVGGLVGSCGGTISNCYSDTNVSGDVYVGGLVGELVLTPVFVGNTVYNSYCQGSVTGIDYVGGLVGSMSDGVVYNSYSFATVSGSGSNVGGLIGYFGYSPKSVFGSYWDITVSGQTTSAGGIGKTTTQMKEPETFVGWGCNWAWTIDFGDYPKLAWENSPGDFLMDPSLYWLGTGTSIDPHLIYTPEELNILGLVPCQWDKHFKLMTDIDMSDIAGNEYNIIGRGIDVEFTGTFDGNDHVISNFSCNSKSIDNTGLFGFIRGNALIQNLGLINPDVDGGDKLRAGALVGWMESGTIDSCYVEGGQVRGFGNIGGLIGEIDSWLEYATVSNCYTTCQVDGTGDRVGGLVGITDNALVVSSFSTSNVKGEEKIGGLVGYNHGSVLNCFATGSVNAMDRYSGGLIGFNGDGSGEGYVTNCYSTGKVTGSNSGGFIGRNCCSVVSVNCFWDIETSEESYNEGGATGLTTAQMQDPNTFINASWDFTTPVWNICEGTNYPRIAALIPAGDFVCPDGVEMNDLDILIGQWLFAEISMDLAPDGIVDLLDWAILADGWQVTYFMDDLTAFAEQWLKTGAAYCIADIAPPPDGDGKVDLLDFALFAEHWLEGTQ